MYKTISLCIIVKNEEGYLKKCLESYKVFVDEIIVVDTGSKDNSPQIAKNFGAKLINIEWKNDFSYARNISLENATSDWILWTDADDVINKENGRKLCYLKKHYNTDCAFSFMIKNSQDGIMGSVFNQLRMFPNHPNIKFRYKIHEQVLPSIQDLGLKVHYTDIMVMHTGYSDPETIKKKQTRNLSILEDQLKETIDNPVIIYSYAGALLDLGKTNDAAKYYKIAYEKAKIRQTEKHIYEGAPISLASLYGKLQNYEESQKWADIAYKLVPKSPQINSIMGELSALKGNTQKAIEHFEYVLNCTEKPVFIPVDVNMLKINACSHLGSLYMKIGEHEKGIKILEKALEIKLGRKIKNSDRGNIYFNKGDYLKAGQEYLKSVNDEKSDDWASYLGLAKIFIIDNSAQDAIETLNLGLEKFPDNEELINLLADLYYDLKKYEISSKLYLKLKTVSKNSEYISKADKRIS